MNRTTANYLINWIRILAGNRLLAPLAVSYCVTQQCNLNCCYCEDFGARRSPSIETDPLPLPDASRVLAVIRQVTDNLILTGGEPLLYPHIQALVTYARQDLRFGKVTMLTNGLLLSDYGDLLTHLDRVVISLDTTDPEMWDDVLRAGRGTAQRILTTIADTARQQSDARFRLIVHCVVTPETLPQTQSVLDFCVTHNIIFSFSPQSVNNWPHYELLVSDEYRAFVDSLVQLKRKKAPILGSLPYLRLMINFEPYACYPLLVPRVMADGRLAYPCRPIERGETSHGGREISLLDAPSWKNALRSAVELYGPPPLTCGSCYQQCYAEPSLMQSHPLAFLYEMLAFAPSRRAGVHTYAPG
jgi:MoaA/NifB/PqqE/SkfB family radical SAM enzyme